MDLVQNHNIAKNKKKRLNHWEVDGGKRKREDDKEILIFKPNFFELGKFLSLGWLFLICFGCFFFIDLLNSFKFHFFKIFLHNRLCLLTNFRVFMNLKIL